MVWDRLLSLIVGVFDSYKRKGIDNGNGWHYFTFKILVKRLNET